MVKISVCTGYSCRLNASERLLERLQKAVDAAAKAGEITVAETFCMGECDSGPCVRVNGVKFRGVQAEKAETFLMEHVLPLVQ